MGKMNKSVGLIILAVFAFVLCAANPAAAIPVDLELSLLVDVSGSILNDEFDLQQTGYENAFRNLGIISAIESGAYGKIAANLIYWSSEDEQDLAVGWMLIEDSASSNLFADAIAATTRPFSNWTGIGAALDYAYPLFATNSYDGTRLVMDISGDGINNETTASATGRANALGAGIDTINGIVIGGEAAVLAHYQSDVIGGTNAFAVAVADFSDFGDAIDDKLIREIKGGPVVPEPTSMMLLGTGLMGMLGFKRRKRS